MKSILITVGTTKFDELIDFVLDNMEFFSDYKLTLQVGSYRNKDLSKYNNINHFAYTNDMESLYKNNDYIICHGGSGTILNGLKYSKPLLVIANTRLLGNHQLELIDKLVSMNLIHTCTLNNFELKTSKLNTRPPRQSTFTDFIHVFL